MTLAGFTVLFITVRCMVWPLVLGNRIWILRDHGGWGALLAALMMCLTYLQFVWGYRIIRKLRRHMAKTN